MLFQRRGCGRRNRSGCIRPEGRTTGPLLSCPRNGSLDRTAHLPGAPGPARPVHPALQLLHSGLQPLHIGQSRHHFCSRASAARNSQRVGRPPKEEVWPILEHRCSLKELTSPLSLWMSEVTRQLSKQSGYLGNVLGPGPILVSRASLSRLLAF